MKGRSLIIVAFVLVCVLTVGVGFAAVSTYIDIFGVFHFDTSKMSNELDKDIKLVSGAPTIKAYKPDGSEITGLLGDTLSATVDTADPDVGSITAKHFGEVGEYVFAQYKIINTGEEAASAAELTVALNPSGSSTDMGYLNIEKMFSATAEEVTHDQTEFTNPPDSYVLEPGETCWLTFKMTVTKLPAASENPAGSVKWTINADAVVVSEGE